jgi:hypothetical protein
MSAETQEPEASGRESMGGGRESMSKMRSSDIGMATHLGEIDPDKPGSICWLNWPDEKWTLNWYVSVRGQESLHVYMWLMKDLCW